MKKKSKEAKFFCESCGSEVPRNSKVCPSCGKFFASVRCPKCSATGSNDDFKDGCPRCGYAINPDTLNGGSSYGINYQDGIAGNNYRNKSKQSLDWSIFRNNRKSSGYTESSLPIWIYVASVLVLLILVICLYSCL